MCDMLIIKVCYQNIFIGLQLNNFILTPNNEVVISVIFGCCSEWDVSCSSAVDFDKHSNAQNFAKELSFCIQGRNTLNTLHHKLLTEIKTWLEIIGFVITYLWHFNPNKLIVFYSFIQLSVFKLSQCYLEQQPVHCRCLLSCSCEVIIRMLRFKLTVNGWTSMWYERKSDS